MVVANSEGTFAHSSKRRSIMRKLILPALVAAAFSLPAFAQVSVGGAVGGSVQSGARLTPPPIGNTASSAVQGTGNTVDSSAQQAEDTAGRLPRSASSSVNAGANQATQAQGVVSSDVKDDVSGTANAGVQTDTMTGTHGDAVRSGAQNAQTTGGQVGSSVRDTARQNAQGANNASQNAINRVNNSGQATANSELGVGSSTGVSAGSGNASMSTQ